MEENKAIKEAVEKVNTLSEDEEMQRLAYLREKGRTDASAKNNRTFYKDNGTLL